MQQTRVVGTEPLHAVGTRKRVLLIVAILLAAATSASAQPGTIIGLPPEAAANLPGIERLFANGNASAPPAIVNHPFIHGQVLARFPLEMADWEIEEVARRSGAPRVERLSAIGLFLLHGPPSVPATERLMEKLWETHTAVTIDANYIGELTFFPDDPHHAVNQWYHEQILTDVDLDLRTAWDITRGTSSIVVAAVDSGIDVDHPEFIGRLYVNPGEIPGNDDDDDDNGYPDDVSGWNTEHGGH